MLLTFTQLYSLLLPVSVGLVGTIEAIMDLIKCQSHVFSELLVKTFGLVFPPFLKVMAVLFKL